MLRPKAPIVAQFELTESCNHKCRHCYNYWRAEDYQMQAKSSNPQDITTLKNVAQSIASQEVFHAILTGGEPMTLKVSELEDIICILSNANMTLSLNSNITLASKEYARMLKRHNVPILASMISSDKETFDKVTNVPGSYTRFVTNAEMLSEEGIYLSANMVLEKGRADSVYETGKFAASIGFKGFNATRISPANHNTIKDYNQLMLNNKDIELVLDQLLALHDEFGLTIGTLNALPYCCVKNPEKYKSIFSRSCVAGLTAAGISSKGELRACLHFNTTYGNILEKPLTELWAGMPVWKQYYSDPTCRGCAYQRRCGGGCRENAFKQTGDMNGQDTLRANGQGKIKKRWEERTPVPDAVILRRGLKLRDENFGGIIYYSPTRYALVDHFTYHLVQYIGSDSVINRDVIRQIPSQENPLSQSYIDQILKTLIGTNIAQKA